MLFQDHNLTARIVEAVVQVNNAQRSLMIKKICYALNPGEHGRIVAILGLTFKPETDDIREAPSLTIIPALQEKGMIIYATDPRGMNEAKKVLNNVKLAVLEILNASLILGEELQKLTLKVSPPFSIEKAYIFTTIF
jgi:UDP-glucose 6-dehydrogenase